MKKLILIMLFICGVSFGQVLKQVMLTTYVASQDTTTQEIPVYDSLQIFIAATDTCDLDLYAIYSATGITQDTTAKLLDLDVDAAADTSLYSISFAHPTSMVKFRLVNAASGNDTQANGYINLLVKHFGKPK